MSQDRALRVVIFVIAFLAALAATMNEALGEEVGGSLTGPLNFANRIGSLALISGGTLIFLKPRSAFFSFCFGASFILPMQSWRLFPGLWCQAPGLAECYGSYPAANCNVIAVVAVSLAVLACILTSRMRTP